MLGAFAFLPACGALLDLPDTKEDDSYGQGDGSSASNDGSPAGDGATSDGTSPLTDANVLPDAPDADGGSPHNLCGDAGKDCFGGECLGGVCQAKPLTTSVNDPRQIVYSGGYAYVISGLQEIDRVDGFGTKTQIAINEPALSAIAVSGSRIYFSSMASGGTNTDGEVSSCPTTGCDGTRKNYVAASKHKINGVASDGTNVYYGVDDNTGGATGGGIYTCPIGTTPCTATTPTLSKLNTLNLQLSGALLYFLAGASTEGPFNCTAADCVSSSGADNFSLVDFAVNNADIVFATQSTISFEPLVGGSVLALAGSQQTNVAVGADDTYAYWLDAKSAPNGVLNRCTIADQCLAGALPMKDGLNGPSDLVVTADSIWFTTVGDHTVWRIAK
ncbi:MAG: hypothetical protein ABI183_08835 [Polyangiaceae bacterium]